MIPDYNKKDIVDILEKNAFCGYGVNRLLKAARNDQKGKISLVDKKITFLSDSGKTIIVDLTKVKNEKRWTFSRFFNYSLKGDTFKQNYHDNIEKFVKKLLVNDSTNGVSSISDSIPSLDLKTSSAESASEMEEPENEPTSIINKFTSDQLKIFSTLLQSKGKISIPIKGTEDQGDSLIIWYNKQHNAINLQFKNYYDNSLQTEKLGLIIDQEGKITSVFRDGSLQDDLIIPDNYAPLIEACYYESLKRASEYSINSTHIDIKTIPQGTEDIPEYHLSQLCPHLVSTTLNNAILDLRLKHLTTGLDIAPGIDAGGPAREFLDNLGKGVKYSKILNIAIPKEESLAFPLTNESFYKDGKLPSLTQDEQAHYKNLGILLMYCYNSTPKQNYSLGQCFHPAVLRAALALSSHEINSNFEDLNLSTQKKMLLSIIDTARFLYPSEGAISSHLDKMAALLEIYDWTTGKPVPEDSLLSKAHDILGSSSKASEAYDQFINEDDYTPDLPKIKANLEEFMKATKLAILTQNSEILPQLGECLAPIHQMAKGMKSVCQPGINLNLNFSWDNKFNSLDYIEFHNKTQGSLDRDQIINNFNLQLYDAYDTIPKIPTGKQEITKKIAWLTEWVKESATNEELESFLKYVTGSSSLAPQAQIHFQYMKLELNSPYPIAHSCFNRLELSQTPCGNDEYNDHTKEGFIKCLKATMKAGGPSFSMD